MSVNNLAMYLSEGGRRAEALVTAQEAVTLRPKLLELNRDAYLPDLAMSVNNLAIYLSEGGRRAEALVTAREAVTLRPKLVELNRDAYLPDLVKGPRKLTVRLLEPVQSGRDGLAARRRA